MTAKKTKLTLKEQYQSLVEEYREQGNEWPAPVRVIAAWALNNDKAECPQRSQIDILARGFQEAMREQYYEDRQGRRVRKKHCFPKTVEGDNGEKRQQFFWCDIESATPDQFRSSAQHRRKQIVADATQLKIDVDSFNDNNSQGEYIQLSLDFTNDVEERKQDTEYNP